MANTKKPDENQVTQTDLASILAPPSWSQAAETWTPKTNEEIKTIVSEAEQKGQIARNDSGAFEATPKLQEEADIIRERNRENDISSILASAPTPKDTLSIAKAYQDSGRDINTAKEELKSVTQKAEERASNTSDIKRQNKTFERDKTAWRDTEGTTGSKRNEVNKDDGSYHWEGHVDEDGNWVSGLAEWAQDNEGRIFSEIDAYDTNDGKTFLTEEEIQAHQQETANLYYDCGELAEYTQKVVDDLKAKYATASDADKEALDAEIKRHESNIETYKGWQNAAKEIYDGWSSRNDYFDSMDDNKKKNVNDPAQYKSYGGDTPENIQKAIDNYEYAIKQQQDYIDTNAGYVTDPMSEATIGAEIDKRRADIVEYKARRDELLDNLALAEAHKLELEQQNADLELRRKYALITGQDESGKNSVIHAPKADDWKSISVELNTQLSNAIKAGNEAEVASLTNELRFVDQQFEEFTKSDLQQKYISVSDEELDKAIAKFTSATEEKQGKEAGNQEKASTVPVRTADDIKAEIAKLHPEKDRDKYTALVNELNSLGNPSDTVTEVATTEETPAEEKELTDAEKWELDILLQEKERREMEKLFQTEYVAKYDDQAALKWYEEATAKKDAALNDLYKALNSANPQAGRIRAANLEGIADDAAKEAAYARIKYEESLLSSPSINTDVAKGMALAPSIGDLQTAFGSIVPSDKGGARNRGILAGLNITGEDADSIISMLNSIGVSAKDFVPRVEETTEGENPTSIYARGKTARNWTQSELDIYYSLWAKEGAAAAAKYAFEVNSVIGRNYHDQILKTMIDVKTYDAEHRTGEFVTEALLAPWVTNPLNITALADFAATTSQVRRIGTAMTSPTSFTPSELGNMLTTAHSTAIQETATYPQLASLLYNSYNSAVGSVESAAIGNAIGSGLSAALGLGPDALAVTLGSKTFHLKDNAAQAIARSYTQLSFFGSAAARSYDDFIKRGVEPGKAWGAALAAGMAEAFFEDFSFDKVYDAIKTGHIIDTAGAFWGNLAASSGIEMSEEVFTEMSNFITENMILDKNSSFWVAVNNYHGYGGMSYAEALKQALKDESEEIGMAAASAIISSMGSVGIPSGISYVEFQKQTAQQAKTLGERIVNGTETAKDLGKKLGEFYSTFTLVEAGQENTLTKGQKQDLDTLHGLAEKAKEGTATAEELGQLALLAKRLDKGSYYAFVRDNKDAWNYISNGDASAAQIDYLASLIGEENVNKFIQASLENPDAFIADDFVAGLREATGVTTEEALKIENALGLVVAGTKTRSEAQIRKALNEAFKSDAAKTYALNYISDKVQQFNQQKGTRQYTLASANSESAISPWLYTVNSETVTSDFEQTMVNVWSGVQRANETLNLANQARALEQFNAKKSATSESVIRQARTQTDGIENFRDDSDMVRLNGKEYIRKDFLESIGKGINPITGESFKNGTPTQDQANIYFDNLLRNALTNDAFINIVDASGTMKNYDAWQESLNTGDIENGRASVRVSENAGRNETAGQSRVGGPVAGSETGGVGTAQPVHTEGSGEAGGSAQEVKLATFDKNGEHDITIKGEITLDTAGMTEEEVEALDNLDSGLKVAITQAMAAGVDRIMIVNGSMTNSNGRVIDGFFGNTKVEGKRKYTIVVSSTGDQAGLTSTFRHELMHRLISGMNAKTKRAFLNTILETAFAGRSELYETIFDIYVKYAYGREYGAANIKDGILSLNKEIVEDIDEEMVCDLFGGIMTWARRSQDSAIGEFYREAYNRIERLVADTGLFDYVRSNWGKSERNQKGTLDISEFKGTQANAFGKRWNGRKVEIPYSRTEISRLMSELRKDFRHMSDEEFAKFEQRVNGMETQPGTRQNQLYTAAAMEIIAEHERRAAESRTEEPTDTQTEEETTEAAEETAETTEETTEATEETEEVPEEKPAERLANNNMTAETDEDFDAIRNTLMKLKNKESFYFNYKDRQFVITVDESTDWGSVYKIALTNNGQLWIKVPIGDASSAQEAIDFIRARMDDTEETTQEATETELDKGQQYLNFLRTMSEQSGEMNEDDFDAMFGSATDEILRGIVGREATDDFERRAIEAAQKEIDRRAAEDKAIAEQDSVQEEVAEEAPATEEAAQVEEPATEEKPAPKKRGRKKKEPAAENGIQTKENLRASEEKGRFVNKRKWTDKTTSPTDGETITRTQFVERMTTTGWDELDDFGYPTHMTMAEAQDMFDEWLMEDRDGGGETMYSITADEAFDALMPTPIEEETIETKFSMLDEQHNEWAPVFYSKMQNVIEDWTANSGKKMPERMGAGSVVSWLKGKGVKDEEIKWSGIVPYLEGKKSVSRDELLQVMTENQFEIETKVLGNDFLGIEITNPITGETSLEYDLDAAYTQARSIADALGYNQDTVEYRPEDDVFAAARSWGDEYEVFLDAKSVFDRSREGEPQWAQYTLPGGEDYREILFKAPNSDYTNQAMRNHWGRDAKGILAFARVDDRVTKDGSKVLFVEEIQSDWHNAGAKNGFDAGRRIFELEGEYTRLKDRWESLDRDIFRNSPYQHELRTAMRKLLDFDNALRIRRFVDSTNSPTVNSVSNWIKDASYKVIPGAETTPELNSYIFEFLSDTEREAINELRERYQEVKQAKADADNFLKENKVTEEQLNRAKLEFPDDVPFAGTSDTYHEYVMKHLLRMAAEGNYDKIGWTTAQQQSDRWSDDYAEGYRIEYDQNIPKFMRKYGKQWGATVGSTVLENGEEVWSVDITPEMKEDVLYKGQTKFSITSDLYNEYGVDIDTAEDSELESLSDQITKAYDEAKKEQADIQSTWNSNDYASLSADEYWARHHEWSEQSGIDAVKRRVDKLGSYNRAITKEKAWRAIDPEALIQKAKDIYGTTDDFRKSGYILPDGTMLDMSQGANKRTLFHHETAQEVLFALKYPASDAIEKFVGRGGAIRIDVDSDGIDIPQSGMTPAQYETLRDFLSDFIATEDYDRAAFYVSTFGKNIGTSERFNPSNTTQILNAIRQYYDTGSFPKQSTTQQFYGRFSMVDTEAVTLDELQTARDEMLDLRQQLRDRKADVDEWSRRIMAGEAEIDDYNRWLSDSGYNRLYMQEREASKRYNDLNRAYDEQQERANAEAEQNAIEQSGLSEADYFGKEAVKVFGYTPYFYDAGYITPNGRMLNFSGEKGKHYGSRGQDHRSIGQIFAVTSGTEAMNRFINYGNIRIMAEAPGLDISADIEPTAEQYSRIRDFARSARDEDYFSIDITDEDGRVIDTIEYDSVNPTKIVNDLKNYYRTGEVPQQSITEQFHSKYAILHDVVDENGRTYDNVVMVDKTLPSSIIDNNREFNKFVKANFAGLTLGTVDDYGIPETIQFASKRDRVRRNGNSRNAITELAYGRGRDRTVRLVYLNADEIVQTSTFWNYSEQNPNPNENHQGFDQNGWEYRRAYLLSGNTIYPVTLNIAQTDDGRSVLYFARVEKNKAVGVEYEATSRNNPGVDLNRAPEVLGSINTSTAESIIDEADEDVKSQDVDEEPLLDDYDTDVKYSIAVSDPDTLAFLNDQLESGEVTHTYKTFLEIVDEDGNVNLYPPMASMQKVEVQTKSGKTKTQKQMANAMHVGVWEESVGNPNSKNIIPDVYDKGPNKGEQKVDEHGNKKWQYKLQKEDPDLSDVNAAYDPYQHSSNVVLNDQFESAWKRPGLVTYECVIPNSELTSDYWYGVTDPDRARRADGEVITAALPVGMHEWHKGVIAGGLKNTDRQVYMTRWLMPIRRMDNSEVARMYKEILDAESEPISVPYNVVPPGLQEELEKIGVPINYEGTAGFQSLRGRYGEEDYPIGKRIAEESDTRFSALSIDPASTYDAFGDEVEVSNINPTVTQSMLSDQLFYSEDGNTAYYQLDTGETVVLDNVGEDSPEARYINYLEAMNNANSSNNTTAQPYTIPPATRNASDGYNLGESNDGLRRGTEEVPAPDQEGALRRTGSTTERNGQSEPQSKETEGVDSKFAVSVSEVFENDKGDPDRNIYDEDGNLITTASTYPLGSDELFFFDAMERGDFSDMEKLVQEYRDKGYTVSESTFDLLSRMVEQNDNMTPEQQEAMQRAVGEARAKYGTLRGNDVGKVESTIPARTNADTKTRRHVGTVAINTNQAMNDALTNETMVNEILGYTPQSNPETLEKARALLRSQYDGDIDKAINHIADLVNSGTMPTAADVALAEIVITELANDASDPLRLNKAVKVTADLAVLGTNLGQAVQAMSLIRKLTPRGQMYYLNGVVKQLNRQYATQIRNGKMQPVRINDALLAQLFAATDREGINTAIEAIKDNLAEQIPVTLWDRWNAWRYLAMLGNPRTHIRNLLGNAAFAPAVFMKDMILRQLQQNTKWVDPSARTMGKADLSGWLNKKGSSNPYVDYAIKDFGLMSDVAKGKKVGNKYADINDILSRRKMFPLEGLNWLNERNSELLEGEDLAFIQRYYVRYMAEFLQARGIKAEDLNTFSTTPEGKALLNQARSWSMQQAHRDTYHEMNTWAMALNKLKHNGRLSYTLMEGVLPFVGTPANILKLAAVNYSPYGLIRSGIQLKQALDRGDKQSTVQILDGIASGLTGTGIMVLGALLARFGLFGFKLRGAGLDDDDEAQFERLMGHQQWAIEGHGISYTLDWAAPMSLPLFTGATFWELFSREHPFASPDELWAGLMGLANPMLSMSMLDGLENTLSSLTYATSGSRISALMGAALTSHLAQAFPTFFGQVNRIIDPVRRTTYTDKNDWMPGALQKFIQQNVYSKVPGLSTRKIAYVDEWGRIDTDENLLSRIFSNFISPGYLSFINETPVDTELRRLYDALGETEGQGVLPNWAEKSVGKQDIGKDDNDNVITIDGKDFTAKEYEKYAQIVGQTRYAMLSEIFSTEEYLSATDTEKAKMVSDAYDYARSLGRKALIPERNMDASWMETAKKVGAVDYIVMRQEYEDNKNNDRIYGWLADNPNLSTDQMAALLTDKFTTPEYIASNEITGYRYKTLNSDDEMLSAMYEVALQNGLADLYKDQTYINASSDERADMFRVRVEEIKSQTISDFGDYLGTTNRALSIGKSSSLNQDTKFEVMLDAYDGDHRAQAAWIAQSYKPDKVMDNPEHPGYQLEIPEEARKTSGWMYENVMSRYQDAYEELWTGNGDLSKKFQDAVKRNDKTAMASIANRVYKETVAMVEEEYARGLAKSGTAVELFKETPTGYNGIEAYDIAKERYGNDLEAIGRYVAKTIDNHTTIEDPENPGFYIVLDDADQAQGKKDRIEMFTNLFVTEATKEYFQNATREQREAYIDGMIHEVDAAYQKQYAEKLKKAGYNETTIKLNSNTTSATEFVAHMEKSNYSKEETIDIMMARYKHDHGLDDVNYNPAARILQIEAARKYYEDHYDEVKSGAMTWAKYRDNASKAANNSVKKTYNVSGVSKVPAPEYTTPTIPSEFSSNTGTVTPPPAGSTGYVIPPSEVTRSRSDGAPSWEETLELNENPDRYNVGDQTTSITDNYNPNGPVYHFEDYIPAMTEEEAREEANWQTTNQNVQIFPDEVGENSIAHDIATEYYFAYLNNPDYDGQTYEDWLNNHRDFTMTPAGRRTYSGTGQKAERRGTGLNNGGMPYGSSANSVGGASHNFWNRLIRR